MRRNASPSPIANNARGRAKSNTDRFSDNQFVANLKGKTLNMVQPALNPGDALKINGISPHAAKMEAYNPQGRGRAANLARIRSLSKDNNPVVPKDFSAPHLKNEYIVSGTKSKTLVREDKKVLKENKNISKTVKNLDEQANEEEKNEQFELGDESQSTDGISWELKLKTNEKTIDVKKKFEMKMNRMKDRAENKTKELVAKNLDVNDQELSKMELFFRFRLYSIFRLIDDKVKSVMMWASTKNKKKPLAPSFGNNNSKESDVSYEKLKEDVWKQLKRLASTKSKYKYRDILNFEKKVQQVLKDLYGKIPPAPKCDMDLELDDINKPAKSPEHSKPRSHDTTVKEYLKTFIIIGGYPDLQEALEKRGWTEVEDSNSTKFHLKWSSKKSDSGYDVLEPYQWVNHFEKNTTFTTKAGLSRNIRNLIWYGNGTDDDVDTLYPLCYDINDIGEFEDFIEQYKFNQAICVLRGKYSSEKTGSSDEINLLTAKICASIDILQKRMKPLEDIIKDIFKNDAPVVTAEEYEILTAIDYSIIKSDKYKPNLSRYTTVYNVKFDDQQTQLDDNLIKEGENVLKKLEEFLPQINFNQGKNAWIVKPAGLSRGRGIACYNNLAEIIDHIRIKDVEWVVQKYMENPLIILNRKFDIRQWVMVTDWNPLTIWFYDECYVRFTANDYNPEDFSNKFSHLTNNSIAKYAQNFETSEIEGNMWTCGNLAEHLKKMTGKDEFEGIQKRMKEITIKSLQSVAEMVNSRKNSFELFGYDFMIDDTLKPWLIEINCSPTMEYSTSVTSRLVKMVMEDVAKVIVDYGMARKNDRKNVPTGLFKCICYGKPLI